MPETWICYCGHAINSIKAKATAENFQGDVRESIKC